MNWNMRIWGWGWFRGLSPFLLAAFSALAWICSKKEAMSELSDTSLTSMMIAISHERSDTDWVESMNGGRNLLCFDADETKLGFGI